MGGKDSIHCRADANLDAAVEAWPQAAFGFQGQKSLPASRAIVDEKIYDVFGGIAAWKDRVAGQITFGGSHGKQARWFPVCKATKR